MTDERHLHELMAEMERVGVDPNAFPAGITARREEVISALSSLRDNAGPAAFLAALRQVRGQSSDEHLSS